ncbi:MAG: MgtC/SapB family protein [Acidobacteriota bacterium]|nr:MgtC/SapB family protein [Blastocatellia bacterium]MDW8240934.1 MgtC/SapB family protein [Acidobacteriota bacterium]
MNRPAQAPFSKLLEIEREAVSQIELFYRFGVALFIGLLIGLQRQYSRERSEHEMSAGVRTFTLIALAGCAAALSADTWKAPVIFMIALGVIGALLMAGYVVGSRRGEIGLTTEVSALITFLCGALCYHGHVAIAVALAVVTTVLLSLKWEMHRFVRHLTREDVYATLKFAVITAIVLPVLPNRSYGSPPWDVLNPYKLWLLVVLISGISFLGYVLIKWVGPRRGLSLTGLLGGLVSSTAVTLSLTQRSQKEKDFAQSFAIAILLSWIMMFARVMVIVTILNRAVLGALWQPMTAAAAAGLGYAGYLYWTHRQPNEGVVIYSNPFELRPALTFAALYALILLVAHTAQIHLGDVGVYLSSIVAGMADVDAITLSMTELSRQPTGLSVLTAAQAIVLATMSNTIVKSGLVTAAGAATLRRAMAPGIALIILAGLGVAFLAR